MASLSNDLRLAVDSGKTALGFNETMAAIKDSSAKAVVMASKNKTDILHEITHVAKISGVKLLTFEGNSMELGSVCGRPHSVAAIAVIEPGNSNILAESY